MDLILDAFGWLADSDNWGGPGGIATRTIEHIQLTAASVLLACLIAVPVGLWIGHVGRGGTLAINISNVGRAVPTLAGQGVDAHGDRRLVPPRTTREVLEVILSRTGAETAATARIRNATRGTPRIGMPSCGAGYGNTDSNVANRRGDDSIPDVQPRARSSGSRWRTSLVVRQR
jgi:hypothetical protein